MSDGTKIWRVYPNGHMKNETHVLWPHIADGEQCTGYNGDIDAWSEHNKECRWGCAQIMQKVGCDPVVIYDGCCNAETLKDALEKTKFRQRA